MNDPEVMERIARALERIARHLSVGYPEDD
jgi:hypothetical protein